MQTDTPDRILRIKTVLERIGLSRSTMYRKMQHGTFPRNVQISMRWLAGANPLSTPGCAIRCSTTSMTISGMTATRLHGRHSGDRWEHRKAAIRLAGSRPPTALERAPGSRRYTSSMQMVRRSRKRLLSNRRSLRRILNNIPNYTITNTLIRCILSICNMCYLNVFILVHVAL